MNISRVYGQVIDISGNLEAGTYYESDHSVEIRVISDPLDLILEDFRVWMEKYEASITRVRQNGYPQASGMMFHTLTSIQDQGYNSTIAILNTSTELQLLRSNDLFSQWVSTVEELIRGILEGLQKSRMLIKRFEQPPEKASPIAESMLRLLLTFQNQITKSLTHVEAFGDVETGGNSDECLIDLQQVELMQPNEWNEWNRLTTQLNRSATIELDKILDLEQVLNQVEEKVDVLWNINARILVQLNEIQSSMIQKDQNSTRPVVPEFFCPITTEPMIDPVIATDGHSYERHAILEWLNRSSISPMTGMKLHSSQLVANHTLRSLIQRSKS